MSSLEPATVSISLEEFSKRGGLTGPHKDGWGVAFYDGTDARLVRDPCPASNSTSIEFVKAQAFRSRIVLSHIRQATTGEVKLANTQPFSRELGGRVHVFAHNGDLPGVQDQLGAPAGRFRPVGDTDSEHAFCALMERLLPLWETSQAPSLDARLEVVARFAGAIRPLGPANFIYSDSEVLFVHGHRRTQPDGVIRPPGLFTLCRTCPSRRPRQPIDGVEIGFPVGRQQRVLLVASVPLTDEAWTALAEGEILVVGDGQVLKTQQLAA